MAENEMHPVCLTDQENELLKFIHFFGNPDKLANELQSVLNTAYQTNPEKWSAEFQEDAFMQIELIKKIRALKK